MARAPKKKTVKVTLEIDVADLSMDELRENAALGECKVSELPRVRDLCAFDIADQLAGIFTLDNPELFAGSDMHIRATGARVVTAAFK